MPLDSGQAVPQHVAIIMDGNRRWAKQRGLAAIVGHRKVAQEMIERLTDFAIARGIKYLTLWAFSTENWERPTDEVDGIMSLFRESLQTQVEKLHRKNVRVAVIGDIGRFPEDIRQQVADFVEQTANNTAMTVVFALNYGGRDELRRAVRRGGVDFEQHLDTKQMIDLPDPDLLIRPGGEQRLSGFLPWQTVYAELYFSEVLMPDFDEAELDKALVEYARRQRRFGK